MKIHFPTRRHAATFMVLAAGFLPGLFAQADPMLDEIGVVQIPPEPKIIRFQQITFNYEIGNFAETDWGRIVIDPARLLRLGRACEGYVNVFIPAADGRLAWAVDNVFVAGSGEAACSGADLEGLATARRDDPFNRPRAGAPQPHPGVVPVVKDLDLRPGLEGRGRLGSVLALVWFSRSPVPNADEFLRLAQSARPERWPVGEALENAEGDLFASPRGGIPPAGSAAAGSTAGRAVARDIPPPSSIAIGPPPQPVLTRPLAELLPIAFPIGVFQASTPNADAALNQCVPAAHANALAYLEQRYNFNPNIWNLPHHHVRGIGKFTLVGDILFWEPVPTWSLVANIDSFTMRANVFDLDSGNGTGGCQNFLGLLKYLHAFGAQASVAQVRHQGSNDVIGENAACDPGNLSIGGLQSLPQGPAPTWEWMRDQLQAGRSLVMGWGRYNDDGEWTGGHKVRVYGAAQYNGKKYLYMLDDSIQGNNFDGLRTFSFEVTDDHTPGTPGVPNGFLEFDSMPNRQIVNAISVEAQPQYLFDF